MLSSIKKKIISSRYTEPLTVGIITLIGILYRVIAISSQLSYWNDESQAALMSRGILLYGRPVTEIGVGNGLYQLFFYYLTAFFFKVFGVNEFAGRLPSVIAGAALIIAIYFILKKLLGTKEAIIGSVLVSLSQIQLAWSTELRPYIWLELLTLVITYLCIKSYYVKKYILDINLILAGVISVVAFLLHGSAVINFIYIFVVLMVKSIRYKKYTSLLFLLPLSVFVFFIVQNAIPQAVVLLFKADFRYYHYFKFLSVNYWWLGIGSLIGLYSLYFRNKVLAFFIPLFIIIYFLVAIFKINTQYVRYSFPAFALLYILFAAGMSLLISRYYSSKKNVTKLLYFLTMAVLLLSPLLQKKIIIIPQYYYSINADIRENPIVDYKAAFAKINSIITTHNLDRKKLVVMDAWNDRIPWYMPHQQFVLLSRDIKGVQIDPYYGEKMIATKELFDIQKSEHPYGLVIIENWPSQTDPRLQDYLRKTLKHEFDVNNLPHNEDDKWSISVYSWGI